MSVVTAILSLDNPVFQTYVVAASIMILKLMLQPWMTVVRMMKAGSGFRSPEDVFFNLSFSCFHTYPIIPGKVCVPLEVHRW